MDLIKIEELIKVLEGSRTEEISVRKGEFSVFVKKGPKKKAAARKAAAKPISAPAAAPASVMHYEDVSAEDYVLSPRVGIFHTKEALEVGEPIEAGQVVGAIESMKLLNDVVSTLSGVITEVLVEDGTPVEYGQPLFKVEEALVEA